MSASDFEARTEIRSVHAERLNGRLAMLGIVIGIATEALTGQGILSQIGLG